MTTATATVDRGRRSQTAGAFGIQELWRTAERLNQEQPGAGEWVPWRTIAINEKILPREEKHPAQETVDRYAADLTSLPPIKVQRDTFVLIDGRHRLAAARTALSDFVLIREEDVADEDLAEAAFLANVAHGRGLTVSERKKGAKLLIARHVTGLPEQAQWRDLHIAQLSGVDRATIARWLNKPAPAAKMQPPAEGVGPTIESTQTDKKPELNATLSHSADEGEQLNGAAAQQESQSASPQKPPATGPTKNVAEPSAPAHGAAISPEFVEVVRESFSVLALGRDDQIAFAMQVTGDKRQEVRQHLRAVRDFVAVLMDTWR